MQPEIMNDLQQNSISTSPSQQEAQLHSHCLRALLRCDGSPNERCRIY